MKVTAILDDELIAKVREATGGKNITESLTIALKSYLNRYNIDKLINEVEEKPLEFKEDFTSKGIRRINRNR